MTVQYMAEMDTPEEYTGYKVDGNKIVPLDPRNKDYRKVQEWIAQGNTPEPAYTQEEIDEYEYNQNVAIQESMIIEGNKVYLEDKNRNDVGATPIINDTQQYDTWMKNLYDSTDEAEDALYKPPATIRQILEIYDEDRDNYEFTRYQDQWGWRWYLRLRRDSVNALALAIYDENGNYLYTTGALIAHPDGGWYTECPAGQADAEISDVYYRWLLGSAEISDLEVYKATEETKSGIVRSDERYDQ